MQKRKLQPILSAFPCVQAHRLPLLAMLETAALLMLTACSSSVTSDASPQASAVSIVFAADSITCPDEAVNISDYSVTISSAGTYILSGSSDNGQVIIDTPDEDTVELILNGLSLNCTSSAPIYVRNADEVFITLAEDSENSLSVSDEFVPIDDSHIDAVIFSKDDLSFDGDGSLELRSLHGHGIVSKDDLVVSGGSYSITAAEDGLNASDSIRILNGSFTISSDDDGMHADSDLYIENGMIDIQKCYEGLEGQTITILGGDIRIVASDDGINASGDSAATETNAQIPPKDMAPPDIDNAPENMTPPDMENMTPPDKKDNADSSANNNSNNDNIRTNAPEKGWGFNGGFDMDADESCSLTIAGGTITIDADGDGIDSNGYFYMTGGNVFIAGPENNGDSALDYGITATISGGSFLALGYSGMAQSFDRTSEQCSYLAVIPSTVDAAASSIAITDSTGNLLLSHDTTKSYNCVLISCPELQTGSTYTLTAGSLTQEFTP